MLTEYTEALIDYLEKKAERERMADAPGMVPFGYLREQSESAKDRLDEIAARIDAALAKYDDAVLNLIHVTLEEARTRGGFDA